MAAYAYTPTLVPRVVKKILGFPGVGCTFGSINITNYNSVLVAIAELSGPFVGLPTVICSGVSSLGYLVAWDIAGKSLKAFYPAPTTTPAGTITLTVNGGAAGIAIGIDADAAQFNLTKAAATSRASTLPAVFAGTAIAAAAGVQVANDTNIGIVQVFAIGICKF